MRQQPPCTRCHPAFGKRLLQNREGKAMIHGKSQRKAVLYWCDKAGGTDEAVRRRRETGARDKNKSQIFYGGTGLF